MRPDQHKKKRSAQYKKKHGIQNDKSAKLIRGSAIVADKSGISSSAIASQRDLNKHAVTATSASNISDKQLGDERNQNTTNLNGAEVQISKDISSSFSRRKIQSNWDRYEGLPDDSEAEPVTSRGVDFTRLLSETGHADAQFRFKDEQSWDDDEALHMEAGSKFFTVDFESLGRHIKAVPLPERLGIPRCLFEVDLLETFDKESEGHASNITDFHCQQKTSHQSTLLSSSSDTNKTDNSFADSISALSLQETQQIQNQKRMDIKESLKASLPTVTGAVHSSQVTGHYENTSGSAVEDTRTSNHSPGKEIPHQSATNELKDDDDDDELDFLLSLENPVQNKHQNALMNDATAEANKVYYHDDVDSTTTQGSSKSPVLQRSCQPSVTPAHDGTDDLENWLDDMLED